MDRCLYELETLVTPARAKCLHLALMGEGAQSLMGGNADGCSWSHSE